MGKRDRKALNPSDSSSDEDLPQGEPLKRQRRTDKQSALFQAYRALGYYTSCVPLCLYKSANDQLIASVVGQHAFYVFNAAKLSLVFMSRYIAETITGVQVSEDGLIHTSLLETSTVQVWNKMHRVKSFQAPAEILHFTVSKQFVFCLCSHKFLIFDTNDCSVRKEFAIEATGMMHPLTYINKFLFWNGDKMTLVNVMEGETIYEFKAPSEVLQVVQSPVVNVVAVGCANGSVSLVNLLYDELLLTFQATDGPMSLIAFLTDASLNLSLMATGSKQSSKITIWDLNAKKIFCQLQSPHGGRHLTSLHFIPNEPVMVSASEDDNSIKMWLFEKGQSAPRLLRERCGHAEAPHRLRFYGGLDDPQNQGARNLVTCSRDGNLRDISILNEFQSMNFSKKRQTMGAVKQFDFSQFRERDWPNVVTCNDESGAQVWSYANHAISKVQIKSSVKQPVTSVAVSLCGNFGTIGYQNGLISKFNLQSGNDKGLFTCEKNQKVHRAEVTGLGVDSLNKYLVSGSLDKTVKLWDFYRAKLISTHESAYPIDNLVYNRTNDLVAYSSADLSVTILNAKSQLQRVRYFPAVAGNKLTDICFSQPDQKWLIVSSLDKCIRVYDIVTGSLVDWIKFKQAPLSIDFAPSGEYLATSHLGSKAVYLWASRMFYQSVAIQKVPEEPVCIDLPDLSNTDSKKQGHADFYIGQEIQPAVVRDESLIQRELGKLDPAVQLNDKARDAHVQLSSDCPYSKWQAIFNLEQIKERNKPKLAKETLPQVPFFLFDLDKATRLEGEQVATDFLKDTFFSSFDKKRKSQEKQVGAAAMQRHGVSSKLRGLMGDNQKVMAYLKSLSPSGVELEIMSLATYEFNEGGTAIGTFLDFLLDQIELSRDSDYCQALLNCCLKSHSEAIVSDTTLVGKVRAIRDKSDFVFQGLDNLLGHNVCMVANFTGVQMSI